jgi:hypothetical protein
VSGVLSCLYMGWLLSRDDPGSTAVLNYAVASTVSLVALAILIEAREGLAASQVRSRRTTLLFFSAVLAWGVCRGVAGMHPDISLLGVVIMSAISVGGPLWVATAVLFMAREHRAAAETTEAPSARQH